MRAMSAMPDEGAHPGRCSSDVFSGLDLELVDQGKQMQGNWNECVQHFWSCKVKGANMEAIKFGEMCMQVFPPALPRPKINLGGARVYVYTHTHTRTHPRSLNQQNTEVLIPQKGGKQRHTEASADLR